MTHGVFGQEVRADLVRREEPGGVRDERDALRSARRGDQEA